MLPIVIRASEEALKLVPKSLRHASYALGASQWQTILAHVHSGGAMPAIITAIFLSIAQDRGRDGAFAVDGIEQRFFGRASLNDWTPSLPVFIYKYSKSPYPEWHRQAWAAAFVLVRRIMILNVGVRWMSGKRLVQASQADWNPLSRTGVPLQMPPYSGLGGVFARCYFLRAISGNPHLRLYLVEKRVPRSSAVGLTLPTGIICASLALHITLFCHAKPGWNWDEVFRK